MTLKIYKPDGTMRKSAAVVSFKHAQKLIDVHEKEGDRSIVLIRQGDKIKPRYAPNGRRLSRIEIENTVAI